MTISPAHLQVLVNLGYSRRESEFLELVAIHSGYFTNRQFTSFAQVKLRTAHEFTSRLVRQNVASFHRYSSGGKVYHLFSRKVYRLIDKDHLRTHRRHELEYIQSRLVALDFVLAHPQYHFLETETEKVAYFQREMNIGPESLPSRRYYGGKSREATTRYFVDGFPLFVSNLSGCLAVTLTYVDPGSLSLETFRTHVRAYTGLLRSLGRRLTFLYVSPNSRLFQAAESEFYRFVGGIPVGMSSSDLMRYFEVRVAWESKERVLSSDVLFLKGAMARYKKFDPLYEKWRSGDLQQNAVERSLVEFGEIPVGTFETCICGSSLSVFSNANGESKDHCSGTIDGVPGLESQTCGNPEADPKPTVASVRAGSRAEKSGARVA
jgi:hypothetical protein